MISGAYEFCGIGGRPRQAGAEIKRRILDGLDPAAQDYGSGPHGNPLRAVLDYMRPEPLENALRLYSEEIINYRLWRARASS